ncbi:hypothetical protein PSTG_02280 [Puccinia striiformis f. sp. tritici PST-78]|uniref:Uncharacterized protein n=1 Tax=Puccinia striiformis f. sp. tritici PST-78 TaxID=1165861 RepID=A0A0L0VZC5_9BASI|nr:hypothetical protein PSTG_02280 [Puccinia striiformis f. sp. tritici PST-78]
MDHVIDDERGYRTDNGIGGVVSFGWQGISNTEDGCGKALDGAATDVEGKRNMATDEDEGGTAPGPSLFVLRTALGRGFTPPSTQRGASFHLRGCFLLILIVRCRRLGSVDSNRPLRIGLALGPHRILDAMAFQPMALRGPRLIWRLSRRLTCQLWSPGFMLKPNPFILLRPAYSSDFDVGFEGEMISRRKREHSSPRKPLGEGPLSPKHFLGSQRRPYNDSSRNTTDGRISLNRASRYMVSIIMVSQRAILEGVQHSVPNASFGLKGDIFLDGNESIHPDEIHCARVQRVENNSSDRNDNL